MSGNTKRTHTKEIVSWINDICVISKPFILSFKGNKRFNRQKVVSLRPRFKLCVCVCVCNFVFRLSLNKSTRREWMRSRDHEFLSLSIFFFSTENGLNKSAFDQHNRSTKICSKCVICVGLDFEMRWWCCSLMLPCWISFDWIMITRFGQKFKHEFRSATKNVWKLFAKFVRQKRFWVINFRCADFLFF